MGIYLPSHRRLKIFRSAICRDVPGEFKISQVIRKYFKCRDPKDGRLVLKEDEKALYHLLDQGMEEFRGLGDVYLSESMKNWKIVETSFCICRCQRLFRLAGTDRGYGRISKRRTGTYPDSLQSEKEILPLKERTVFNAGPGRYVYPYKTGGRAGNQQKGLTKRHHPPACLQGTVSGPYLKEGPGITYYRDQLFKSMVRAVKTVEDSDEPVPARFEAILREYQKTGFRWMKTLDKCGFGGILADDMGLGKTIQVIALFEDTYSSGEKAPSLVVCPASLVYNWEQEIQKFAPDLKVRSVVGTGPQRLELLEKIKEDPSGCQILITSYDLLKRDIAHYEGIDFRFQIIDEAQYIKNATYQTCRLCKTVQVRSRFVADRYAY